MDEGHEVIREGTRDVLHTWQEQSMGSSPGVLYFHTIQIRVSRVRGRGHRGDLDNGVGSVGVGMVG